MVTNQPYRAFQLSTDLGEEIRNVTKRWWVVALLGVATAVLGICLLVNLATAVGVLAILVAVALIVDGFNELVTADRERRRWPHFLLAVVWIVVGVIALAWPAITLLALAVTIGVGLIVGGATQVAASIGARAALPMWGLWLALGLLTIAIGVISLAWPGLTILTLAILLGIILVVRGVGTTWFGLQLRRAHRLAV